MLAYGLGSAQAQSQAPHTPAALEKACAGGGPEACFNVGVSYLLGGNDAVQDPAKAVAFLTKPCDGGEMSGCTFLGLLYINGDGVAKDFGKAISIWTDACTRDPE